MRKKNSKIPKPPELDPVLLHVWNIFISLHNRRQIGFNASPLTINDINEMLDMEGIKNKGVRKFYFNLISVMDDEYMKGVYEKAKSKEDNNKGK